MQSEFGDRGPRHEILVSFPAPRRLVYFSNLTLPFSVTIRFPSRPVSFVYLPTQKRYGFCVFLAVSIVPLSLLSPSIPRRRFFASLLTLARALITCSLSFSRIPARPCHHPTPFVRSLTGFLFSIPLCRIPCVFLHTSRSFSQHCSAPGVYHCFSLSMTVRPFLRLFLPGRPASVGPCSYQGPVASSVSVPRDKREIVRVHPKLPRQVYARSSTILPGT